MKTTLYLAKEPDAGVRNDLSHLSGEVTIVDCLNAYGDYYRKMGYNVISKDEFFELDGTMRFDVTIGNPPYSDRSNVSGANEGGCSNNLDSEFFLKSIELSDRVCLIIRAKHFLKKTSKFRNYYSLLDIYSQLSISLQIHSLQFKIRKLVRLLTTKTIRDLVLLHTKMEQLLIKISLKMM